MKIEKKLQSLKVSIEFESEEEFEMFREFLHNFPHGEDYSDIADYMWEELKQI